MANDLSGTTDAPTSSLSALLSSAHRWKDYLTEHSAPYRELQQERERGWKSPSLDRWYTKRRGSTSQSTSSAAAGNGTTHEHCSSNNNSNKRDDVKAVTHFAGADIPALARRYCMHAQRSWGRSLRSQRKEGASGNHHINSVAFEGKRRRDGGGEDEGTTAPWNDAMRQSGISSSGGMDFLDLGAAPGGVSTFLIRELGWSGVGVTLSPATGGIAMDEALVSLHRRAVRECENPTKDGKSSSVVGVNDTSASPSRYLLYYGDVTEPETTWTLCGDEVAKGTGEVEKIFPFEQSRFRFVHGGAVQDFGQRAPQTQQGEDSNTNHVTAGDKRISAVLPWFTLLIPQLDAALRHVQRHGSFLLVFGAPHCASFFIFLRVLSLSLGDGVRMRVFETMHLGKPPVYVLCEGVEVGQCDEEGANVWYQRQRELLQCMSPQNTVVCPSFAQSSEGSSTQHTQAGQMDEKRLFWLGESGEGFRLAQEGFAICRRDVEQIWGKMRTFLRRRREMSERDAQ